LADRSEEDPAVTASVESPVEAAPTSRRALLAGAIGGLGAWLASAIGGTTPVSADTETIHVGDEILTAETVTRLKNGTNANTVFWAESISGVGVAGTSDTSYGVLGKSNKSRGVSGESTDGVGTRGYSANGIGVQGDSDKNTGVHGSSNDGVGVEAYSASSHGVSSVAFSTSKAAILGRSLGHSTGVEGYSGGVLPAAKGKTGVHGYANQDSGATGVWGESTAGIGVRGDSSSTNQPAILGRALGSRTGVQGVSGGSVPFPKNKTGVYGYAAQDSTAVGVWGETSAGMAVRGTAVSGYAGYFGGKVFTTAFYELLEVATPGAPAANRARLFVRDNGAGKTQLCVRFNTGAVKVLATEP
jgi:hypothetical protein